MSIYSTESGKALNIASAYIVENGKTVALGSAYSVESGKTVEVWSPKTFIFKDGWINTELIGSLSASIEGDYGHLYDWGTYSGITVTKDSVILVDANNQNGNHMVAGINTTKDLIGYKKLCISYKEFVNNNPRTDMKPYRILNAYKNMDLVVKEYTTDKAVGIVKYDITNNYNTFKLKFNFDFWKGAGSNKFKIQIDKIWLE